MIYQPNLKDFKDRLPSLAICFHGNLFHDLRLPTLETTKFLVVHSSVFDSC